MTQEDMPEPLPEDWLPDPVTGEAGQEGAWTEREREIVRAAEPRLRKVRRKARGDGHRSAGGGWLRMSGWWRPAAAAAAAAVLILLLTHPPRPNATGERGSPALGAIVTGGEPTSLWRAAGREADPVLALITLDREAP